MVGLKVKNEVVSSFWYVVQCRCWRRRRLAHILKDLKQQKEQVRETKKSLRDLERSLRKLTEQSKSLAKDEIQAIAPMQMYS